METFLSTSKDNSYVQFWFGSVAEHMRAKVSFQCICNLWAFSHWKFSKSFVLTCNILKCAHFRGYSFVQVCACICALLSSLVSYLNSIVRLDYLDYNSLAFNWISMQKEWHKKWTSAVWPKRKKKPKRKRFSKCDSGMCKFRFPCSTFQYDAHFICSINLLKTLLSFLERTLFIRKMFKYLRYSRF